MFTVQPQPKKHGKHIQNCYSSREEDPTKTSKPFPGNLVILKLPLNWWKECVWEVAQLYCVSKAEQLLDKISFRGLHFNFW